jgi:hypothetical protein
MAMSRSEVVSMFSWSPNLATFAAHALAAAFDLGRKCRFESL